MVLGVNKWIHPDATLLTSKVVYNVKFVGMTEAKGPRGIDVVNDALQKLKFSRHIKRTEGAKPPKVELSINIHGVKITDSRTKVDLHDIPLHRVSFCADDKQDKRMFSFIAKSDDGKHYCYGLDSQHEANNITLTIGQSFELAYTSFLKTDKGVATSKQVVDLNKRIHVLEKENSDLKQRISELEKASPAKSMEHHKPQSLQSPSNAQSKAPEIPSKDAFDMPLFSPTHSPLVKIASPSQVYPTRGVPRRRSVGLNSPSSNSTDSSKQPQDPFGEITKLNRHLSSPEEGFSKGLTMQEAELSLDAFDPLKSGH